MFARIAQHAVVLLLIGGFLPAVGWGAITYDFDQGKLDGHDGDGVLDTATFTDDESAETHTLTTVTVNSLNPGAVLVEGTDTNVSGSTLLGIDIGDPPDFDTVETWEFNWDVDTILTSITFQSPGAVFSITSTAWSGRSFDDTTVSGLSYVGAGEFEFDLDAGTTIFNNLTDVGDLRVSAGTDYTFTAVSGTASLDSFTFATATAIPEPGSAIALLGIAGLAVGRRFRRKRKQAATS